MEKKFTRDIFKDLYGQSTSPLPLNLFPGQGIVAPLSSERKRRGDLDWIRILAYITGSVDKELLLRNKYLVSENRILRNQIRGRLRQTDEERKTLAELGHRLGKRVLAEIATVVRPGTILCWHRKLVARKFDGYKKWKYPGRPRMDEELEA